jgi:pyruvate/2-oxoglutarate dehydrogenase complex dihydrolipoamide acyltransferase (E2) component
MPTEIYLVKVGMNMTEGVVEEWYVPDGGTVEKGELIYRLETEKVNLDVDAEASGTVKHAVAEGVTMKPGDVVGHIYAAGEDIPDEAPAAEAAAETATAEAEPQAPRAVAAAAAGRAPAAPAVGDGGRILSSPAARRLAGELDVDITALSGTGPGGRIVEADVAAAHEQADTEAQDAGRVARSSPMARRLARELEVDLAQVRGTGPGGRVTKEDVEAAARPDTAAAPEPSRPAAAARGDRTVPVKGMRKTIAARMHESLQSMAQLTMDMDVVMDAAVRLRTELVSAWEEDGVRPSYTDLVIKAVARALEKHPQMNATFSDTEITLLGEISVGVAVALEDGLIVPVVRDANVLGLASLARESARLAAAARDGKLSPDDLQGGTFTVSPLGMFGVDAFTPIINAPQVGILGVNRIREDVAWDGDRPVKQQRMRLSLTWDHRALDGAPAARFLATVRDLLESPLRLLA